MWHIWFNIKFLLEFFSGTDMANYHDINGAPMPVAYYMYMLA